MKKIIIMLSSALAFSGSVIAQKVVFEEFDLKNGLHVVLHQDNSAPVIVTAIMYHVGSKDEKPDRTGFAHFFEHLLFEGTENIKRGEWFKIVTSNGGVNNANTNEDRTYYYEVFPSNNLELGLWMEAERLGHPVINDIGVQTQNEVVKEEKRSSYDNRPYGNIFPEVKKHIFQRHPYRWSTIGSMDDLDAASLEEFLDFYKQYYIPNNAVLVVAGNFNSRQAAGWVEKYFGPIEAGAKIERKPIVEIPINKTINATYYDPNIQLPMLVTAYRTPSMKTRDAKVLDLISSYLSDGKSSKLYKKVVDQKKIALEIGAFNHSQEDYGTYVLYGIPMGNYTVKNILSEIDEEIKKLQTELISERDYQKLMNKIDNEFVNKNATIEGMAHNLATYYLLYGDINLINTEIDIYHSISREEIRQVAKLYLNSNQRLVLNYAPASTSNASATTNNK